VISASITTRAVERRLQKMGKGAPKLAKVMLRDSVLLHQKAIRNRFGQGSPNFRLHINTGALARSLRIGNPKREGRGYRATSNIGKGAPYAWAHEKGGTITPRRKRYLRIPLSSAKTRAGVVRQTADIRSVGSRWETKGRVPGQSENRGTFIIPGRNGSKLIAVESARPGKVIPLWLLKRSVKLPKRLGFRSTWRKQAGARAKLYRAHMKAYLRETKG
jgi:hypothetical protein